MSARSWKHCSLHVQQKPGHGEADPVGNRRFRQNQHGLRHVYPDASARGKQSECPSEQSPSSSTVKGPSADMQPNGLVCRFGPKALRSPLKGMGRGGGQMTGIRQAKARALEEQICWTHNCLSIILAGCFYTQHLQNLGRLFLPFFEVTVVVDRNVEDAKKFAEKFSIEKCSDSFTDISENPEIGLSLQTTHRQDEIQQSNLVLV